MAQVNIKALFEAAQWGAKHPEINDALAAAIHASTDNKNATQAAGQIRATAWDAWNTFAVAAAQAGATPQLVNSLIDYSVSDSESAAKTVKTYRYTASGLVGVIQDEHRTDLAREALGLDASEAASYDWTKVKRNEATKLIKARVRRTRVLYTDRLGDAIRLLASTARDYASVEASEARAGRRFDRKDVDRGEMAQMREEAAKEALDLIEDCILSLGGSIDELPTVTVDSEADVFDEAEESDPMAEEPADGAVGQTRAA